MAGPVKPSWAATEAKGPGSLTAFAAGRGGGPRVQIWNGTVQLADFFAYEPTQRGGVNVAWGSDGILLTGPGPGGGPVLKRFTPYGREAAPAEFRGDPADRRGFVPVAVDVPRDVPVAVQVPPTPRTYGDPHNPNVFRVWLMWVSLTHYDEADVALACDDCWKLLGPAGNLCLVAGPPPADNPGSYGTVVVGQGAPWIPGADANGSYTFGRWDVLPPGVSVVDPTNLRACCWVGTQAVLPGASLGPLIAHEIGHGIGIQHSDSNPPGQPWLRMDLVKAGLSRAATLALPSVHRAPVTQTRDTCNGCQCNDISM